MEAERAAVFFCLGIIVLCCCVLLYHPLMAMLWSMVCGCGIFLSLLLIFNTNVLFDSYKYLYQLTKFYAIPNKNKYENWKIIIFHVPFYKCNYLYQNIMFACSPTQVQIPVSEAKQSVYSLTQMHILVSMYDIHYK